MIDHIREFLSQQVALQVMCARDPERPYVPDSTGTEVRVDVSRGEEEEK